MTGRGAARFSRFRRDDGEDKGLKFLGKIGTSQIYLLLTI